MPEVLLFLLPFVFFVGVIVGDYYSKGGGSIERQKGEAESTD
ncbi:hypothetical protein [Cytobacillus solani]|nr:hypothetical protein [Cytobacillus solani]